VFDELLRVLHIYGIRNVVTFPDSGKRIAQAIKDEETPEGKNIVMIRIFETNDMEEAVKFAYKFTKNGKICLLSTASPSYSLWKNFEEK
jgi:UDP-N-acetylmuramoylalanine-D-glutamate ligase